MYASMAGATEDESELALLQRYEECGCHILDSVQMQKANVVSYSQLQLNEPSTTSYTSYLTLNTCIFDHLDN